MNQVTRVDMRVSIPHIAVLGVVQDSVLVEEVEIGPAWVSWLIAIKLVMKMEAGMLTEKWRETKLRENWEKELKEQAKTALQ